MVFRKAGFCTLLAVLTISFAGCDEVPERTTPAEQSTPTGTSHSPDVSSPETASPDAVVTPAPSTPRFTFVIPDQPVEGMIRGTPFKPTVVKLNESDLIFQIGDDFIPNFQVNLKLARLGELEGKTFEFADPNSSNNPPVYIRWQQSERQLPRDRTHSKYVLKIQFHEREGRRIAGLLHYRSFDPDDHTELAGHFVAAVGPNLSAPPTPEDAPYVYGNIKIEPQLPYPLAIHLIGELADGTPVSNQVEILNNVGRGGTHTTLTNAPQITSLSRSADGVVTYRHIAVPPGVYFVCVRWRDRFVDGKWLELKADSQIVQDFTVDSAQIARLDVTIRRGSGPVLLAPANENPDLEFPAAFNLSNVTSRLKLFQRELTENKAQFEGLKAGKYWISFGPKVETIEIKPGNNNAVTLPK